MMRRVTGVLLSLLLLNAVSLRSGVFCEFAHESTPELPGVADAAPGGHDGHGVHQMAHDAPVSHQNSSAGEDGTSERTGESDPRSDLQCVLMLLCAQSSVVAARAAVAAAPPAPQRVIVHTTRAPAFVSAAPEPPPPKA